MTIDVTAKVWIWLNPGSRLVTSGNKLGELKFKWILAILLVNTFACEIMKLIHQRQGGLY